MKRHGQNFIGSQTSSESAETYRATHAIDGYPLETDFHIATDAEVDRACQLAASAFLTSVDAEKRAAFLETIAEELIALGDTWIECAHQETALPTARLIGERARTCTQLQMFADLVRDGSWVDARISHAKPDRMPLPAPDLRRMLTPIGPVAVYGASNFPFAFSVAGGDTASALAAGCSVVVKAHPAHPGTSEMATTAVLKAVQKTNMPDGIFSMLHGHAPVSLSLIRHPKIAAAGFTGSLKAGRALCDAAANRPYLIPVHAEMGSVNPIVLLPTALANRGEAIATGLAQSVMLGVGQFCTNPGLVIGIDGPDLRAFIAKLSELISAGAPGTMLTSGILASYKQGVEHLIQRRALIAAPLIEDAWPKNQAMPMLFQTTADAVLATPDLLDEVFGPSTLVVICRDRQEMAAVIEALPGQLTATVQGDPEDFSGYQDLISAITQRVGRLLFNGYPTGVEVAAAMQHGGPWPAASDSRFTSVGTGAILRFARPISWQNAPQELLPLELQDDNPCQIWRIVDNVRTQSRKMSEN